MRPVNPVNAPAEETSQEVVSIASVFAPHPIVTAHVEVPVLIAVVKFEFALIEVAAHEMVAPEEPVRSDENVLAPANV